MKVFLSGGTGSIGAAIVKVLIERGHEVVALGRSDTACSALRKAGAQPLKGDLTTPADWIDICDDVDAVIHAAAVWGEQMGEVDRQFVDQVLPRLALAKQNALSKQNKVFIYTGGCWMYGQTADLVANEQSSFDPLPDFAWAVDTIKRVLSAKNVRAMVIHPAMVYERNGGVFEHIIEDAKQLGYVRVVGSETVRWPLIHREDLAILYVLMMERGNHGDVYNAATNDGVCIGEISRALARRLGVSPDLVVIDVQQALKEIGSWAEGYALDQQMSGQKAREELGWRPEFEDVFAVVS